MVRRVAIIDDSQTFYEGISMHLAQQPGIVVLPMARSYTEAMDLFQRYDVDVAFIDLRLPDYPPDEIDTVRHTRASNGFFLIEYVTRHYPETFVIAMSTYDEPVYVVQALSRGAKGFVHRDSAPAAFCQVLQEALKGCSTLAPHYRELLERRNQVRLTEREMEVLQLLCQGLTNKTIAQELRLAEGTVRTYVESLRQKFHARTRGEVCARARRLGVLFEEV